MSSRLPTRRLSRSVSSSMVRRNSFVAAGVQATSRCMRLVTDALIDASGVRRSWRHGLEQRRAQRVGLSEQRRPMPPRPAAGAGSSAERQLRGEGLQDPLVVGGERRPDEGEPRVLPEVDDGIRILGRRRHRLTGAGLPAPSPRFVPHEHGRRLQVEGGQQPGEHRRQWIPLTEETGRHPGQRLGLGASAAASMDFGRPPSPACS